MYIDEKDLEQMKAALDNCVVALSEAMALVHNQLMGADVRTELELWLGRAQPIVEEAGYLI